MSLPGKKVVGGGKDDFHCGGSNSFSSASSSSCHLQFQLFSLQLMQLPGDNECFCSCRRRAAPSSKWLVPTFLTSEPPIFLIGISEITAHFGTKILNWKLRHFMNGKLEAFPTKNVCGSTGQLQTEESESSRPLRRCDVTLNLLGVRLVSF